MVDLDYIAASHELIRNKSPNKVHEQKCLDIKILSEDTSNTYIKKARYVQKINNDYT
jgi:uncharacterized membrane protein